MKPLPLRGAYETFIRVGYWDNPVEIIRTRVAPLCESLAASGYLQAYCYLIHDRDSGVPTRESSTYVHVRLWPRPRMATRLIDKLPKCCVMTRAIDPAWLQHISGLEAGALHGGSGTVWAILCEQSAWFSRLLLAHRYRPPSRHVRQFLHFFANMAQTVVE